MMRATQQMIQNMCRRKLPGSQTKMTFSLWRFPRLPLEGDGAKYTSRVIPGRYEVIAADQRRLLGQQLRAEYGGLLDTEYRSSLRADADIEVLL